MRHKKRLTRDIKAALKDYEALFSYLSSDARQLLIYLLDLLSLFAQQSDVNLMTARNLAAIFQPSIMSHPQHDMDPKQYEMSRFVVEFLIEYSYKLLPHLLKNTRNAQKPAEKVPAQPSPDAEGVEATTTPQTIISPEPRTLNDNEVVLDNPITPTTAHVPTVHSHLSPPSPSFLEKRNSSLKYRPHSKSLSHTHNASEIISGMRTSRFPWLNRALSNDTGELTGTEEECEEEDEEELNSPISTNSGSVPKQNFLSLPKPRIRSMSGNSVTSGGTRPLSLLMNKSVEELAATLGMRRHSGTDGSQTGTDDENESRARSRSVRRNSWFQRLRSRSRSANRT